MINKKKSTPPKLQEQDTPLNSQETESVKKDTPPTPAQKRAAERMKKVEARRAVKREAYRKRKVAQHDIKAKKLLAAIDRAEAKEKAATSDPTTKREIEVLAAKKRKETEIMLAGQRRALSTSTGSKLSYERKKSLYGYAFVALWIIGVLFIFLGPLAMSIQYSLNDTELVSATEIELYNMSRPGIKLEWNNFAHYKHAFNVDVDFMVNLGVSLGELGPQVMMVLIFSLFVAVLLNQKFKGRTLMRAIFFFPVLIATGPVISVINGTMAAQGASGDAAQFSSMFQTDMVDGFMRFIGLYNVSEEFTTFIADVTSDIFNLLWKSGIQILIFLSALQQIPTSAKEAASMEGATAWEFFWKITFPTISPMILANLIYTIIDTFSDSQNTVMKYVMTQVREGGTGFGYGSALAWIYFGIIALALAIVVAIVSRFVFYQVD